MWIVKQKVENKQNLFKTRSKTVSANFGAKIGLYSIPTFGHTGLQAIPLPLFAQKSKLIYPFLDLKLNTKKYFLPLINC